MANAVDVAGEPTDIGSQVACVEREVGMRARVYPSLIMRKRLTEASAGKEMSHMKAVARTMRAVKKAAEGDRAELELILGERKS